jgi:hypothetical protein
MNFQMPGASSPQQLQYWAEWNHCDFNKIKILHYHGTRGPERAVQMATALSCSVMSPDPKYAIQEQQRPWCKRLITWCTYNTPGVIGLADPVLSILNQECQAQGIRTVDLSQTSAITIVDTAPLAFDFHSPLVILPEGPIPARWIKNQDLSAKLSAWMSTHSGLSLQVIQAA